MECDMDEARKHYEANCQMFIRSGGDPICFGRLEGMQDMARSLGHGDCFKDIRDKYMDQFQHLVTNS
jgi:hypothetical protein